MADATEKKYVDFTGLTTYDGKIKALINSKDADTLKAAKDYADGLADNYDAAGSAASALEAAKTYADGKDAAIAAAKAQADKGVADAATAKAAADAAQGDVDALETYVGAIPEGATATSVVAYVDEKTAGIASDAALTALAGRVTTAEGEIDAIQADYLKAADKTELQGNIDAVSGKVTTLVGTDTGKSVRAIANEELVAQLIPETAAESLDTLQEIAAWIQAHPGDASAMNQAITALQNLVGTIPADVTDATTIVAYIQKLVAAEKTRAEGVESGLDSRIDALETAVGDGGSVADQIATAKQEAIDAAAADATSKANAAQSAAEATAKSYTDTEVGKVDAKVATNTSAIAGVAERMSDAEGEIDALQAASHTHDNKAVIDGITAQLIANWNDASSKAHTHDNKEVLDGITAAKVSAWGAAEANAKSYTDAEIAKFVPVTEAEINGLFA